MSSPPRRRAVAYGDPAPKGSATLGGTFDGTNPNGAWSLYAVTVGEGDGTGSIAGDWSIDFAVSSQTVSFSTTAPSPGVAGNTYAANASATSTLPVTYSIDSSSTSGTCLVNAAGQVSFLAAGTCVLDANQSGDGNWSAAPQAQQVITVVSPPGAPTGLTAFASDAQVALSWLGPTNNGGAPLTLYNIYEGTSPGGETLLTSISAVCSGVSCGKVQSFVATGLTNGTTYYFEVTAVNSVGESSLSNEVSATPATLPGAPTGLAAAPGNTQVALSWTAPPSNGGSAITSYNVYEGTSSGGETLLQSTGSSATTFTATGLTNGTKYYFYVTAVNGVGEGPASPEASATPATVPVAPTALTATASDTQVALTWTAPANNGGEPVSSYNIYQGTSSGGETLLQNTASTATTFTSTGLTNGTTYYFEVTAVNSVGESLSSNEVSATPAVVPGAPTMLTATAGNAQVALVWGAPTNSGGDPVIGYQIYQGTSPGGETLLTSTSTTTAAYTSTGLSNGTTYYFVVSAVTSAGEGPFSNEASATPATLPGAPTGLTATGGDTQVVLDWAAPASNGGSAIMFYNVYEGTAPGAETLLGSTGTTSTTFTPTGLTNGTTYYFEVAAVNGVGQGPVSNETSATPATPPGAPTGLTATRGNTQVALAWNAPTASGGEPVTSYNIYQGTVPGAETLLTRTNGTSYTSAGLTNGTEYYFVVTAVNGVGESLVSNEASATPATVPGAPTALNVAAGNTEVFLTWAAPASNGGSAVTSYNVYKGTTPGGESLLTNTTSTSYTATGLTNGTTYYFEVTAINTVGEGPFSNEASAMPVIPPPPPPPATTTTTTTPPPLPQGYLLVSKGGQVYSFGSAVSDGSVKGRVNDIVGLASTADGGGYWVVGSDGRVFSFGDARNFGPVYGASKKVDQIVGIAPTANGAGYWLAGSDGQVYAFGNAHNYGSIHSPKKKVDQIVGIAATADGRGYWLAGSDGTVHPFGDAHNFAPVSSHNLRSQDIVGITATTNGAGYWLVGSDGRVFAFGNAQNFGSATNGRGDKDHIVGMTETPDGQGYWVAGSNGTAANFGDAKPEGPLSSHGVSTHSIVGIAS